MPKTAPPLTATQVKALRKKPGIHNVGSVPGLLLQVSKSGAASWILRATIDGRVRQMGLGSCGKITLETARLLAHDAHAVIADGGDPIEQRRSEKRRKAAAVDRVITFKAAATRYHRDVKIKELRNQKVRDDWLRLLELHAFPVIGGLPVGEIARSHVLKVLEPLWPRPTATQNLRPSIEAVLDWSAVRGYREGENPAAWRTLKFVLSKPSKSHKVRHYAAVPWSEAPSFIADLRKVGTVAAKALEFVILTAARSGEVRQATWDEIDFDAKLWVVPPAHTKREKQHRVPLSKLAIRLLESLPYRDGLLFPGGKHGSRELYDFELGGKLKLGREVTVHGWRSSFKDWARSLGTRFTDEASELALAHVSS
ncbi:MAG: integrase arm-type DNA-binding domain-containing protein, partial [Proteobacteria bacterium]|nr:integrase arm-type DNA-binding domain-containing protein [Pseudomonadota bacterium]